MRLQSIARNFAFAVVLTLASQSFVEAQQLYGLIDSDGKTILPFEYAKINTLDSGSLLATPLSADRNSRLDPFLIDSKGKRLNDKYEPRQTNTAMSNGDLIRQFTEVIEDGKWGLKAKDGHMSIPLQDFRAVRPYPVAEDLFLLKDMGVQGVGSLLQDGGSVVAELPEAMTIEPWVKFCNDRLLFKSSVRCGFIDKTGRVVIEPGKYLNPHSFSEGFAEVQIPTNTGIAGAYIDTAGNIALGPYLGCSTSPFENGCAVLYRQVSNGARFGVINKKGKTIIAIKYSNIQQCGDYFIAHDGSHISILSNTGSLMVQMPDAVTYVWPRGENGWYPAAFGGKPAADHDRNAPFDGSKVGFVDQRGHQRIAPIFEEARAFKNNKSIVAVKDESVRDVMGRKLAWGAIDQDGKFVLSPNYTFLQDTGDSVIAVKNIGPTFDAATWRDPTTKNIGGYSRVDEWHQFLDSYNLIGMSRKRVFELLGDPDDVSHLRLHEKPSPTLPSPEPTDIHWKLPQVSYHLWNGMCGNLGSTGVQIEFGSGDVATAWRSTTSVDERFTMGPWVKENVRHDPELNKGQLDQQHPSFYVPKTSHAADPDVGTR